MASSAVDQFRSAPWKPNGPILIKESSGYHGAVFPPHQMSAGRNVKWRYLLTHTAPHCDEENCVEHEVITDGWADTMAQAQSNVDHVMWAHVNGL